MGLKRMDNVGIIVDDLDATIAFFTELGLELEGRADIEGEWADQAIGLEDNRCEIAMMRMPDGHGRLELARYTSPAVITPEPSPLPPNTLGFHRVMFAVDDIDDVVRRLERLGGQVLGEIARYEDVYRLCYLRSPQGFTIGLAEELG